MGKKIYGVDVNEKVTPEKVRDAIMKCFIEAHKEEALISAEENDKDPDELSKSLVKRAFEVTGGNFNNPTKKDLIKAMDQLALVAKSFRNPKVIKTHYSEINALIDLIK